MVSIDVSKLSYAQTLAQLLHVILGGAAMLGVAWYSPQFRNFLVKLSEAHVAVLIGALVLSVFVAYLIGSVIYAPLGVLLNVLESIAKNRSDKSFWKKDQVSAPPVTWTAIRNAFLQKAGIQTPSDSDWKAWFLALHQIFPADQIVNARMGALMAGLGLVLAGLAIQFPDARSPWFFVAIPVAILSGLYYIWTAVTKTSDPKSSVARQQRAMMTYLLKTAEKSEAKESDKQQPQEPHGPEQAAAAIAS